MKARAGVKVEIGGHLGVEETKRARNRVGCAHAVQLLVVQLVTILDVRCAVCVVRLVVRLG